MKYRSENHGPDMLVGSKMSIDALSSVKQESNQEFDYFSQSHNQRERTRRFVSHPTTFGSQGICSDRSSYNDPVILSNEQTLSGYNRQQTLMVKNIKSKKGLAAGSKN